MIIQQTRINPIQIYRETQREYSWIAGLENGFHSGEAPLSEETLPKYLEDHRNQFLQLAAFLSHSNTFNGLRDPILRYAARASGTEYAQIPKFPTHKNGTIRLRNFLAQVNKSIDDVNFAVPKLGAHLDHDKTATYVAQMASLILLGPGDAHQKEATIIDLTDLVYGFQPRQLARVA